jgi:hypothetical protein
MRPSAKRVVLAGRSRINDGGKRKSAVAKGREGNGTATVADGSKSAQRRGQNPCLDLDQASSQPPGLASVAVGGSIAGRERMPLHAGLCRWV